MPDGYKNCNIFVTGSTTHLLQKDAFFAHLTIQDFSDTQIQIGISATKYLQKTIRHSHESSMEWDPIITEKSNRPSIGYHAQIRSSMHYLFHKYFTLVPQIFQISFTNILTGNRIPIKNCEQKRNKLKVYFILVSQILQISFSNISTGNRIPIKNSQQNTELYRLKTWSKNILFI